MVTEVELFASSPRLFLGLLSTKLFNDAVNAGLTGTLAATMDIAVRAMNGADAIAALLDHPAISVSTAVSVLSNANIGIPQLARILGSRNLSVSKTLSILNNTSITPTADKYQSILYQMADSYCFGKLASIIASGASDATITTATTLTTGVNRYNNLTINSGVTLTLGAAPGVIIANTLTNSGTIASGWVKASGGAAGASGAGAGGNGAGGIIILANTIAVGTIRADGAAGGNGSTVAANGAGGAGGAGAFWEISGYPAGTGGKGGYTYGGSGSKNAGGGGGGTTSYGGGAGGSATVTTYASPSNLLSEICKALADWWLVNVVGKTPTTTKTIPSLGGSGGGGGSADDGDCACGGGGGGGGQIIIIGETVGAGIVTARGGAGGNGGTEGNMDAGGGGGGGGVIYVFYKTLTGTFTFDVSGGAGGTGDQAGTAGTAGSAAAFAY